MQNRTEQNRTFSFAGDVRGAAMIFEDQSRLMCVLDTAKDELFFSVRAADLLKEAGHYMRELDDKDTEVLKEFAEFFSRTEKEQSKNVAL